MSTVRRCSYPGTGYRLSSIVLVIDLITTFVGIDVL